MKQPIKAKKKPIKKSPLYVNDENDYRYKAYSDSSNVHSKLQKLSNSMKAEFDKFKPIDGEMTKQEVNNYSKDLFTDKDSMILLKSMDSLDTLNNKEPKLNEQKYGELTYKQTEEQKKNNISEGSKYFTASFPKPKQPVFIKGSAKAKIAREQEKYGVEADGIWGAKSQAAKDKYLANEASTKKKVETERVAKIASDKKAAAAEKLRLEKEAEKAKQSEVLSNGLRRVSSGSNANDFKGEGGSSGWFRDSRGNLIPASKALKMN